MVGTVYSNTKFHFPSSYTSSVIKYINKIYFSFPLHFFFALLDDRVFWLWLFLFSRFYMWMFSKYHVLFRYVLYTSYFFSMLSCLNVFVIFWCFENCNNTLLFRIFQLIDLKCMYNCHEMNENEDSNSYLNSYSNQSSTPVHFKIEKYHNKPQTKRIFIQILRKSYLQNIIILWQILTDMVFNDFNLHLHLLNSSDNCNFDYYWKALD